MEGTYDMPYKNPYFFVTTEPNWMGVFAEKQIISHNFIILKAYTDQFTISKDTCIDAESLVIFFGTICINIAIIIYY